MKNTTTKERIRHDYAYVIVSSVYEHWSDDSFDIVFLTLSLDKAKERFAKCREECEISSRDEKDSYVRKYFLRKYILDHLSGDYETVDECNNILDEEEP